MVTCSFQLKKLQCLLIAATLCPCHVVADASRRMQRVDYYMSTPTTTFISLRSGMRISGRRLLNHAKTPSSSSEGNMNESPLQYKSWSTASPDSTCKFHKGAEERKAKLHQELKKIGIDQNELFESPKYQGCVAALRTYTSFIIPKSEGALAMVEQPKRAQVVANNIAFLLKEYRSHQEEWLRNHDRALEETCRSKRKPIIILLDNVRSGFNVGNILRSAEAANCHSVLLCGSMTPSPPHPKVLKTAMGAAEYQPYKVVGSTLQAIQMLKKEKNVKVIGVETTSKSIPLWKSSFFHQNNDQKVAFVFGNEMIGVDTECLKECDELISLPTHGVKNSLNVANCVSVVLWEALRQLHIFDDIDDET